MDMDRELEQFLREYKYWKREWDDFYRKYNVTRKELTEMRRELGVREGRILADQMDELEQRGKRDEDQINHIRRDVIAMRKLLEYNEMTMKEVMKALSLIYRNVDELEEGILPNPST